MAKPKFGQVILRAVQVPTPPEFAQPIVKASKGG